jgi:osmotically-inducible protein OsmY
MIDNLKLQQNVQNAIQWEPSVNASDIGVRAHDGVVTLSGTVNSYARKINAENAAKKVKGVKALAEDIIVDFGNSLNKDDTKLAKSVLKSYQRSDEIPDDKVKITVENGWVNLEGQVAWKYQKDEFQDTIKNIRGIKGVNNLITVESDSIDILERKEVENALTRNWSIDAEGVKVNVTNNTVKLTGLVHSLYQKEEAGRLAWNAKGVWTVENDLAVVY